MSDLKLTQVNSGTSFLAANIDDADLFYVVDVSANSGAGQGYPISRAELRKAVGGALVAYDATILAESSLTHYWPMNEAAGATSLADAKGSTALPITDTISNVQCGVSGTIADGSTAVMLKGTATKTNGIITFPSGVVPSSGSYSIEMVLQWDGVYAAVIGVPFNMDTNGTGTSLNFYIRSDDLNRIWFSIATGVDNWKPGGMTRIGKGTHILITVDSTANLVTAYFNGVKMLTTIAATPRQTSAGGFGSYMPSRDGGTYPYMGKVSKVAIYNAALTAAQAKAHADAALLS